MGSGFYGLDVLTPSDFLQLEYANKDKLYLPVYRLNVIQKYVGAGEGVALDKLGSQQFAKAIKCEHLTSIAACA